MISPWVTSGSPPPLVAPAVTATLNMVAKHTGFTFFISLSTGENSYEALMPHKEDRSESVTE